MKRNNFASELGVFKPLSHNVQHIHDLAADLQHHRYRITCEVLLTHRGIPAYNDFIAHQSPRRLIVEAKPRPLDQIAASVTGAANASEPIALFASSMTDCDSRSACKRSPGLRRCTRPGPIGMSCSLSAIAGKLRWVHPPWSRRWPARSSTCSRCITSTIESSDLLSSRDRRVCENHSRTLSRADWEKVSCAFIGSSMMTMFPPRPSWFSPSLSLFRGFSIDAGPSAFSIEARCRRRK